MILQSLVHLYEELKEQGKIESPGWGRAKVSHRIVLGSNGELLGIISAKVKVKSKNREFERPCDMTVPEPVNRTSGVKAGFLYGGILYFFGFADNSKIEKIKDEEARKKKKLAQEARAKECFVASKRHHHEILDGCQSPAAKAVLNFFDTWNPEAAEENPIIRQQIEDLYKSSGFIFEYNGIDVHKDPEVQKAWLNYKQAESMQTDEKRGQCLVTGEKNQPIAILHPPIKGIRGARPSGARLVSFNWPSFESYGHHDSPKGKNSKGEKNGQGLNAPVSKYAAYAYGAALNYLLANRNHVHMLSNTTVVSWVENAQDVYTNFYDACMYGVNSGLSDKDIQEALGNLIRGLPVEIDENTLNPNEIFYILGLSPNTSRASVRLFIRNSFGTVMKNVWEHQERMRIEGFPPETSWIPFNILIEETVNQNLKKKETFQGEKASPVMVGNLTRAVMNGQPYPEAVYRNILLRVFLDRDKTDEKGKNYSKINFIKAGFIKAYLLKNHSKRWEGQLKMALNENCKEIAYVLGRLFSVLEDIQKRANPQITSTIKDRYFNAACSTPAIIFPGLLKLSNAHLRKIDEKGSKIYYSKKLQNLLSYIPMPESGMPFPKRLSLEEQGAFILGYYQETQARYSKKEEA